MGRRRGSYSYRFVAVCSAVVVCVDGDELLQLVEVIADAGKQHADGFAVDLLHFVGILSVDTSLIDELLGLAGEGAFVAAGATPLGRSTSG